MTDIREVKTDLFVSVILVASELMKAGLRKTTGEIQSYLDASFSDYELVIIEDNPRLMPDSDVEQMLKEIPSVRVIKPSYNIDYVVAVTSGLENSIGDYVVIYNPNRDPIEIIVPLVDIAKTGIDIVVGVDKNAKKTLSYKLTRPLVSLILKEVDYQVPRDATSLRCLSRTAVNAATKTTNYHHQIFVKLAQCGLPTRAYVYCVNNAAEKRRVFKAAGDMFTLLVFNSTKPLRWMSAVGIFSSLFSLLFATYSFVVRLVNDSVIDGWSSTVILISVLFTLLFIILSFFGEYLGRLLDEQSKHEPYWIINERCSSVMLSVDRVNVTEASENMTLS